jgi:type IV pilus assembly protein PilM
MKGVVLKRFRSQPAPAIGLDVGSESVKLLQLIATPEGLKVSAAVRKTLPDNVKGDPDRRVDFAARVVREALRERAFVGRTVAAALPKELVHYKTHRLPPMAPDDVAAASRIDARELFRFDPASTEVQVLDAGEISPETKGDGRREVILVAAGKPHVDEFVLALQRAGARLNSLDVDPCAGWRAALHASPLVETGSRLLLDIGAFHSRLMIGTQHSLRVVKSVDVGADQLRNAISRRLGMPPAEVEQLRRRPEKTETMRKVLAESTRNLTDRLARDVLAAVRHHAVTFPGPAPRRVELIGGDATDAQIRSSLSAALFLPAKPINLFADMDATAIRPADRTPSGGEWAVALGLALKSFPTVAPRTSRATVEPIRRRREEVIAHA